MNDNTNPPPVGPRDAIGQVPTYDTATLLRHHREAVILHAGERYRLRVTSNGKLILIK